MRCCNLSHLVFCHSKLLPSKPCWTDLSISAEQKEEENRPHLEEICSPSFEQVDSIKDFLLRSREDQILVVAPSVQKCVQNAPAKLIGVKNLVFNFVFCLCLVQMINPLLIQGVDQVTVDVRGERVGGVILLLLLLILLLLPLFSILGKVNPLLWDHPCLVVIIFIILA